MDDFQGKWNKARLSFGCAILGSLTSLTALANQGDNQPAERIQLAEDIRWVFGTFLFAFVTTEILKKLAGLLIAPTDKALHRPAALMHLGLAIVVVLLSWLGWSLAIAHGAYPNPGAIFEPQSLFLIVDFALLVSYYALVVGIDVHPEDSTDLPSIKHMLLWTVVIFVLYLVWDLLWVWTHGEFMRVRCLVPAICVALAYIAYKTLANVKVKPHDAWMVYFTDGALISLFVAFRSMRSSIPRSEAWEFNQYSWLSLLLLIIFAVLLVLARRRKV
jgi:hypothetical protein